jgi:hypothetical protein
MARYALVHAVRGEAATGGPHLTYGGGGGDMGACRSGCSSSFCECCAGPQPACTCSHSCHVRRYVPAVPSCCCGAQGRRSNGLTWVRVRCVLFVACGMGVCVQVHDTQPAGGVRTDAVPQCCGHRVLRADTGAAVLAARRHLEGGRQALLDGGVRAGPRQRGHHRVAQYGPAGKLGCERAMAWM